jgi:hypothetical protein
MSPPSTPLRILFVVLSSAPAYQPVIRREPALHG